MAIMINCATDWTLDLAWNDADSVSALPLRRGVRSAKNLTEDQKFMQWLKTSAKFFAEDWEAEHDGHQYDRYDGWVGDAWLNYISDCLSDWYKDTYNQRPHFRWEFFAMMCGLPTNADTVIRWDRYDEFCRDRARENREAMERELGF